LETEESRSTALRVVAFGASLDEQSVNLTIECIMRFLEPALAEQTIALASRLLNGSEIPLVHLSSLGRNVEFLRKTILA
jgi:hypothetical protein